MGALKPEGAVACGHPATAAAAQEILREGGNAFDAIIAAQLAACVAEPVLTSLGGGGFLLAHPANDAPLLYDFFAHTPRRPRPAEALDFRPIHADFGTAAQEFHIGRGAIATPGVVRGLFAIHRDLCTLPMTRLVEPAVRAAREGILINPLQGYILGVVAPIYTATAEARALYGTPLRPGAPIGEGERLVQGELAATLEALGREGEELFYAGEIGQRLVELCREGGHLGPDDLRHYRVIRRPPLEVAIGTHHLLTNPPPSSGGILAAFVLKLLEGIELERFGSTAHLLRLGRAMAAANAARHGEGGALQRLAPELLARYRVEVAGRPEARRGTTHLSVMDGAGNIAALTVSNGEGCGHPIPGTGVMPNNMLGEEDLNPGGFHRWPADIRLTSMMAPTLLESAAGARVALGSGGSNRLRSAIVQVVLNLTRFGMSLEEAVEAPRIHLEGRHLSVEAGFDDAALEALLGAFPDHQRWPGRNLFFGGVHAVAREAGRFSAAGDPRRGGAAAVLESD